MSGEVRRYECRHDGVRHLGDRTARERVSGRVAPSSGMPGCGTWQRNDMYHGVDRRVCTGGRSLAKGDRVDEAAALSLARRLCPELPYLVPAADMDRLAGELTGLIKRGETGEPVGTEILGLLSGY